jgi:ABC-type branched-subunit amino acid transport system substrate-binding protein
LLKRIIQAGSIFVLLLSACTPVIGTPIATLSSPVPGQTLQAEDTAASPEVTATTSPTPENVPDLTGETIVLPAFCDQSSVLASSNSGRIRAIEDAANAINAAGGIFGAQLDLRIVDTMGNPEEAQRALARIVREFGEGPLVLICDPQTTAALSAMLNEDELPAIGPGDFAERDGFIFGVDATPQQHVGYFIDDLMAHWDERKPEGAANEIRLALISWNAEVSGMLTSEDFLIDLQDLGVQIAYQADLPADLDTDIYDVVYQLRDANANVIFTNFRGFGLAEFLNALQALGLRERFIVGTPSTGYDTQLFEFLADPANAQGLYLTSPWAWWSEAENPGIQMASELGSGEELFDWGYIEMAGAVALAEKALEDAILEVGFASLSPEAVSSALEELVDYLVMSGLFSVDYSGGKRSMDTLRTWQVGTEQGNLQIQD